MKRVMEDDGEFNEDENYAESRTFSGAFSLSIFCMNHVVNR